jgi:nucleotide-binding universal stress UspA family protein
MYRHLLVPIDASDLSVEVVGNAVGLARSLGARITFFHAVPNASAHLFDDSEVVRAVSPESYAYAYTGRARELLAKAEAAARACGVPCDSMQRSSDKPPPRSSTPPAPRSAT